MSLSDLLQDGITARKTGIMDELEALDKQVRPADDRVRQMRKMMRERIAKMRTSLGFLESALKDNKKALGTAFHRQGERMEQVIADYNAALDALKPLMERQRELEAEYEVLRRARGDEAVR